MGGRARRRNRTKPQHKTAPQRGQRRAGVRFFIVSGGAVRKRAQLFRHRHGFYLCGTGSTSSQTRPFSPLAQSGLRASIF